TQAGELLVALRAESRTEGRTAREMAELGDRLSNEAIIAGLAEGRPGDAILSEESVDDRRRLEADRVWIVDPLDGTREFTMPERTDWAVHVALWERTRGITSAAVALPALGLTLPDGDAPFDFDSRPPDGAIRALVSDSRPPAWIGALAERLPLEVRPMGSAGAKAMAVVRGEADAYLHAGGQYEWDSAAPVGVAGRAGLHTSLIDGTPLMYNQANPYLPDLLICRADLAERLLEALTTVGAT
ncbi:MAG: 3'(2'),5'-bisphosphate nucleotidase CysQ, partial [Actinomycetes bacterium]